MAARSLRTVPNDMSSTRWLLLTGAALLLAVASRGVAADAPLPAADAGAVVADAAGQGTPTTESVLTMASCIVDAEAMRCLQRRAIKYREQVLAEQRSFAARALEQSPEERESMMGEAEELFDTLVPGDGKEDKDFSNSRGHKLKKKIHKLIKIIKLIVFIVVMALKMVFLMFMLQTHYQLKLVGITFMILLIKKYYLWVEWKHKKEEKKAVVYYEHAQHQHHYDESDHYHDGLGGLLQNHHGYHKDAEPTAGAEPGGAWGGWWGKRSAESAIPPAQQMAYAAHLPVQHGLTG